MTGATPSRLHQGQPTRRTGQPLGEAGAAMILIHGRGATAESILELAGYLPHPAMTYLAPQAAGQTWYPYSFLAPLSQNEPYLSSALARLGDLLDEVTAAGISPERIVWTGFSQGACLAAEFVARRAQRYGGVLLFSGGLIGPPGTPRAYEGQLAGTPVFLGCSDRDAHIPVARVEETAEVLTRLGAVVDRRIYPRMGHTINDDEIAAAAALVAAVRV